MQENERPFFMQAISLHRAQNWKKLQAVATGWTASSPNNPESWYYLGQAYVSLADDNNAIKAYESALKAAPKHSRSVYALGLLMYQQGNVAKSLAIEQTLHELNPMLAEQYQQQRID